MRVDANRPYCGASVFGEGSLKTIADVGVACAGKLIKPDWTQKARLERVACAALREKHPAARVGRRHRKNEPPREAQPLEPGRQGMGRSGACDDDIAFAPRNIGPVAVDDGDLRPLGERLASPPRQEFVDLLETLGPEDPRTNAFRRSLAARLF